MSPDIMSSAIFSDDHSRVKLQSVGEAGSDYINASWIDVSALYSLPMNSNILHEVTKTVAVMLLLLYLQHLG